jgi:hypothetical protein
MENRRDAYIVLAVKPDGKKLLGRLRRRWKDNIKISIQQNWVRRHGLNGSSSG